MKIVCTENIDFWFIYLYLTANNNIPNKENKVKDDSNDKMLSFSENEDYLKSCPSVDQKNVSLCSTLQYPCISCNRSIDCRYGGFYDYKCVVKPKVVCNVSIF